MNTRFRRLPVSAAVIASLSTFAAAPAWSQTSTDGDNNEMDEVIVEAAALPRTVEQLAQPTQVLRGQELEKKISSSLGETLSLEPGVSSTFFGPAASRPVIRGQGGERVRMLSNGLDMIDASALSEDHQVSVDGILADRIEIIRGPATMLYGSGAAGGLVNVVDNRIIQQPLDGPFTGKLALNTDSALGEVAGAGYVAFGTDKIGVHLDYFRRDTDDYDIPGFAESARFRELEEMEEGDHDHEDDDDHDHEEEEARGTVENSDSETEGAAAAISYTGDRGFIGVSFSTFDSNYGVVGHSHEHEEEEDHDDDDHDDEDHDEEEEEIVRIDLEQRRFDVRGGIEFDGFIESLNFRLAQNDYEHTEFEGDEVGTVFESDGIDSRIELRHASVGRLQGAFGFQYKNIDFNAVGDEAYVPQSDTTRTSLFAFEEFQASDTFRLQGSLRIEEQTIDGPTLAIDYDDTAVGAALGGIWTASDSVTVALNYSWSERHPNSTELYADGPHVAVQRFELGSVTQGNGLLDKELSNNLDLTVRGNTERFDWTVTVFQNQIDDYINLAPTDDEDDGFQVFEYGQLDAEFYGYEAEARFQVFEQDTSGLRARIFSDYVHGQEDDNVGAYLPLIPPLRFGLGLDYSINQMSFGVEVIDVADQNKVATNELPTDGYTLLNAEFTYSMADNGLFLFVKGRNLGDEEIRQHTSPLKDLAPLPGRAVQAGIRWDF